MDYSRVLDHGQDGMEWDDYRACRPHSPFFDPWETDHDADFHADAVYRPLFSRPVEADVVEVEGKGRPRSSERSPRRP